MKSGVSLRYQSVVSNDSIPLTEKLAYGIGDFGCNMIYANVAAFLTFFYTDVVGMSGAIIGTIILVSRVFDGFSDVAMGTIVDRTHSKYGKARPWIFGSSFPLAIGVILLFTKPSFGDVGNAVYLMIVYNFTMAFSYTMYSIPHGTLVALMTQDQYDRSLLNISRMGLGTLGALFINIATIPMIGYLGGGALSWSILNVYYGIAAAFLIIISFAFTKERIGETHKKRESIPLKIGIQALFKNKYWKMVLALGITTYGIMATVGIMIYYVKYILGNVSLMGTVMTFYFVSSIIGMILTAPWVKKHGKRSAVFAGFAIYVVGTVVILIGTESLTYVIAGILIRGLGFAPLVSLLPSFIADTIEYGEYKTGVRNEGLVYSSESFGQKFGNGLFTASLGWMLALSGYVGDAPVQTERALTSIVFLFAYLPVILYGISVVILVFYHLEDEYSEILEKIRAK